MIGGGAALQKYKYWMILDGETSDSPTLFYIPWWPKSQNKNMEIRYKWIWLLRAFCENPWRHQFQPKPLPPFIWKTSSKSYLLSLKPALINHPHVDRKIWIIKHLKWLSFTALAPILEIDKRYRRELRQLSSHCLIAHNETFTRRPVATILTSGKRHISNSNIG